jgi:hypothetical protein
MYKYNAASSVPQNKGRSELRVFDIAENRTLCGDLKKHPPHNVA